MKRKVVIRFCLLVMAMVAACQPTRPLDASDLYGVWVQSGTFMFFIVDEDGRYYYSAANSRDIADQFGTYRIEGNSITITADADSPDCATYSMTWDVEVVDTDNLIFTPVEIGCPDWEGVSGDYPFARFSP
ncbi:MAG: hypothetical protein JXA97_04140 [Anaerolineales bacterium]|nr:hypothetical protein [Anaerolineales bacterium]